jgi:hypothetical protein
MAIRLVDVIIHDYIVDTCFKSRKYYSVVMEPDTSREDSEEISPKSDLPKTPSGISKPLSQEKRLSTGSKVKNNILRALRKPFNSLRDAGKGMGSVGGRVLNKGRWLGEMLPPSPTPSGGAMLFLVLFALGIAIFLTMIIQNRMDGM